MSEQNCYQERFWKEMVQIKFKLNYIDGYFNESEKVDRYMNIFLAITTNGSICSWAIWNKMQILWGAIIAISQFVNAIKSYLPYATRKKYLFQMSKDVQSLFLFAEKKWYEVAEGLLTENEIHNLTIDLREKFMALDNKNSVEFSLPEKQNILNKATQDTKTYFNNFYGEQ